MDKNDIKLADLDNIMLPASAVIAEFSLNEEMVCIMIEHGQIKAFEYDGHLGTVKPIGET